MNPAEDATPPPINDKGDPGDPAAEGPLDSAETPGADAAAASEEAHALEVAPAVGEEAAASEEVEILVDEEAARPVDDGRAAAARERLRLGQEVARLNAALYEAQAAARRASEEAERVRADAQDQLRRAQADFANVRKRAERDREEMTRTIHANLIKDLLPIFDNLDLAMGSWSAEAAEDFHKGVELIMRQLHDTLGRYELRPMSAAGQEFDPMLHEAVSREATGRVPENHVVAEFRKGYYLGDRLLRPAMVVVAVPPQDEAQADSGAEASAPPGEDVERGGAAPAGGEHQ